MYGEYTVHFMLESLIENKLLEDDSKDYAFLTYDYPTIVEASKKVVESIGRNLDAVSIDTKKRVKILMEFMGIALSLYVHENKFMIIARNFYRRWLEETSIFGDNKRQNKFIRRIFKQLSKPFEMKLAPNTKFDHDFYDLLLEIINDYSYVHVVKGKYFEKETWTTLFYILVAIVDKLLQTNFAGHLSVVESSILKRNAISCCFSVIHLSGIKDPEVWAVLNKYSHRWSVDIDFAKCWNILSTTIFNFMISKYYNIEYEKPLFSQGYYLDSTPVDKSTIAFLFHQTLYSLDFKQIHKHPDVIENVYKAISSMTNKALEISSKSSKGLYCVKFPAQSFLKLFGRFLTFSLPSECDEGYSINIISLLKIISYFELDKVDEEIRRYIASFSSITIEQSKTVFSFIQNAYTIFSTQTATLPFISHLSLDFISKFQPKELTEKDILNISTLYLSSTEVLHNDSTSFEKSSKCFELLWQISENYPTIRFKLLMNPMSFLNPNINIFQILKESINKFTTFQKFVDSNSTFSISFILYISLVIRNKGIKDVDDYIITLIFDKFTTLNTHVVRDKPKLLLSTLQLLLNVVEYYPTYFNKPKNVDSVFNYCSFVSNILHEYDNKRHKSETNDKRNQMFSQPEISTKKKSSSIKMALSKDRALSKNTKLFESNDSFQISSRSSSKKGNQFKHIFPELNHLFDYIRARINLHIPLKDIYSHKIDSDFEINENSVIEKLGLNDTKIHYYTVGKSLLVSFIEKNDSTPPYIIFARGPFGKSIWTLTDDYQGNLSTPKSLEFEKKETIKVEYPKAMDVDLKKVFPPIKFIDFNTINPNNLNEEDEILLKKYKNDNETIINWNEFGEYYPFGFHGPSQRPKVIDFLSTLGMLEANNKSDIRQQTDEGLIKKAIQDFDLCSETILLPIKIIHLLPSDKEINYNVNQLNRMTPLMLNFLNNIAENIVISEKASNKRNWPKLKCSVPALNCSNCFAAFLSPALIDNFDNKQLEKLIQLNSPIKIIFNESNFRINYSKVVTIHKLFW